jgi:hypothetical protein
MPESFDPSLYSEGFFLNVVFTVDFDQQIFVF